MMKPIVLSVVLSGCAMAPHLVDTGISGAMIAGGGSELNPIGFPAVVLVKFAAEGAAEESRQKGDRHTCARIAGAARYGSWIGTGSTLGGLAGGPVGMVGGALVAIFAADQPARDSAFASCYGPGSNVRAADISVGWNG